MATYAFDEQKTINGTLRIGASTINSSAKEGLSGNIISSGHRRPYVTGGSFTLNKNRRTAALVNGTIATKVYTDYQASYSVGDVPFASPVLSKDVNKVLADTNPSRAIVDLPVSIAELRDIPHMLRSAGELFKRSVPLSNKVASGYLNWEFGVKPTLKDLKGVLDFQVQVDRRTQELSRMYSRGGARYRRDNGSNTTRTDGTAGTFEGAIVRSHKNSQVRSWIVVKWIPIYDIRSQIPPLHEIHRRAFRAVFGLNVSLSTVWEALPWSWLIDWFASVGDYLQAHRNSVGFKPGICFQMTESNAEWIQWIDGESPPASHGLLHCGPSVLRKSQKLRAIVTPSAVSVSVPFLSARQVGILGSLAILRLK